MRPRPRALTRRERAAEQAPSGAVARDPKEKTLANAPPGRLRQEPLRGKKDYTRMAAMSLP